MRPSARPQRSADSVTPKLLCASRQPRAMFGQYIARSATMPTSETIVVETSALASAGSTVSTLIVIRLRAGMVTARTIVAPLGSR